MPDKLYIKEHIPIKSIKDVIDCLYRGYDGQRTPYASPTYFDEACTQVECNAQRRSFDDILILVKTYYPRAAQKAVMEAMKELKLKFYFCHQIKKLVFHFTTWTGAKTLSSNRFDKVKKIGYAQGTFTPDKLSKIYDRI